MMVLFTVHNLKFPLTVIISLLAPQHFIALFLFENSDSNIINNHYFWENSVLN